MDTLLQRVYSVSKETTKGRRFNPCFNGYTTSTILGVTLCSKVDTLGFNPCFNGYTTSTSGIELLKDYDEFLFQSLF